MPKRVIDFDAMWASDKLASCADWAQAEYAWFYGLADASGSFELTNLRVIWGRVAAIRTGLTLARVTEVFEEFARRGLLFTWEENGKRYGHWTGSDVPGRLPAPSWRARLERLAPPVPREELRAYMARFGGAPLAAGRRASDGKTGSDDRCELGRKQKADECGSELGTGQLELKLGLEGAQGQDLDSGLNLSLDLDSDSERQASRERWSSPSCSSETQESRVTNRNLTEGEDLPEQMLAIYEAERGNLPGVLQWNEERRRQCVSLLAEGTTLEGFRAAVRRAAAIPFLAGGGERGWRASFDWLIGNGANVRKVLEGRYDPAASGVAGSAASRGASAGARGAQVGAGPQAAAFGARVKPAALERNRSRNGAGGGDQGADAAPRNAASLCARAS